MKIFKLIRCHKTVLGTYGVLIGPSNKLICNTVEREWAGNKPNESCIPEGFYVAHRSIRKAGSANSYPVYMLEKVLGRTVIQIHVANKPSELLGCIATVTSWADFDGEQGGGQSKKAHDLFMEACGGDARIGFWLKDNCWDAANPPDILNTGE